MIEHEPWVGEAYRLGGLMLWGFSHHRKNHEPDTPRFTIDTINQLALTDDHRFFARLKNLCGGSDPVAFWTGVAFANTLPNTLSMTGTAPAAQMLAKPLNYEFVVSSNGSSPVRPSYFRARRRELWPPFNGSYRDEPAQVLATTLKTEWGSCRTGASWETLAYNLPHPQYQRIRDMRAAVTAILAHKVVP
jgi:hypothetical protein